MLYEILQEEMMAADIHPLATVARGAALRKAPERRLYDVVHVHHVDALPTTKRTAARCIRSEAAADASLLHRRAKYARDGEDRGAPLLQVALGDGARRRAQRGLFRNELPWHVDAVDSSRRVAKHVRHVLEVRLPKVGEEGWRRCDARKGDDGRRERFGGR